MTCVRSSARSVAPGVVCVRSATWFAIVAVGRKSDASWPRSSAIRALQLVDGRILEVLLVSDLGVRHRVEHRRRRLRERVGAEIDHCGGRYHEASRYRDRMDLTLLETTLRERGEPAYRAGQVWEWTARGAAGYEAMTNLPRRAPRGARRVGAVLDARRSRRSASRATAR